MQQRLPLLAKRALYGAMLITGSCTPYMAVAGMEAFKPGTVITEYGKVAAIKSNLAIPAGMKFKVAFDLSAVAKPGELNRHINTLARFINMHVAAGVKLEDISLAMVVHGQAANDMTQEHYYQTLNAEKNNANKDLIAQLVKVGVRFYVCGQTAAYYGMSQKDLLPGVDMALSALTAHAVLAHEGYSVNPF
ncbi:DsrE family protein [Shewanella phaeophyticola]|uniref:DsrE family protein n=1 Tax=Shewanella phaeophyticola TaxID=2978345 RepID=A0ABT2P477_9GAMM|nr:DsrE family protein [Shewanella sp. KJ10-1]MCT8987429.1 DsrE family protein [Shewanella sp. KJ10-1]